MPHQAPTYTPSMRQGMGDARPDTGATGVFLIILLGTGLLLQGDSAASIARQAALGVGGGLAGFALLELRRSWRNLFRADLLALFALYFLSLFEFLFDQSAFDHAVPADLGLAGTQLVLWGFAGLAVGRHLLLRPSTHVTRLMQQPTPPRLLITVFWLCVGVGYLHMLLAVSFNPVHLWEGILEPRFRRPWGRGRLGGWYSLIYELGLFRYLIPPLAGIVIARYQRYRSGQVAAVASIALFLLFEGFASGTRNVFGVYLLTFLVGYAFALPQEAWKKAALAFAGGGVVMVWATSVMLAFRGIGLRRYVMSEEPPARYLSEQAGLFVDHNLRNISELTAVFPDIYDYLGLEIVYLAIVRPIPRALWPGKPEGLSVGIEEALGVEGLTLATTFVGEAYMSGGILGIVLIGAALGMLAGWWTQHLRGYNSDMGILIYASGLFAFAIGMRSMLWLTTGILPAIAAIVLGVFLMKRYREQPPTRPPGPRPRGGRQHSTQ